MSVLKICAVILSIIIFIIIVSYIYLYNTIIQVCILFSVLAIFAIRTSLNNLFRKLNMIIWIALFMLAIVTLLTLINLDQLIFSLLPFAKTAPDSNISFFSRFLQGINIIMNFINTTLFLGVAFSFISIDDFFEVPLDIKYLKWLLLGKTLFTKGTHAIKDIEFYISQFPNLKAPIGESSMKIMYGWFKKNLIILLALIFYIMQESKVRGELIENRIKHCFFKGKVNYEG